MNSKKVLHLIKSLGRGGAEMLLPETIRHHDPSSWQFHCIYFLPWKDQMVSALKEAGVEVVCLPARNNLMILGKVRALIRYVREHDIDVIHCHLPWAGIVGRIVHRLTGIPVVYTEHNKQERYHFLTRMMNLATLSFNTQVIAVSRDVADSIVRRKGADFPLVVVPNGIDLLKYAPARNSKHQMKEKLGIAHNALVIGNVCVFRLQKRLDMWLEEAAKILKRFPSVKFVLVGDGILRDEVNVKIRSLSMGDSVMLPGLQQDVRPFLSAMDVFMISSQFEGLPLALLEAMAMELPVVACGAGGIPEVIESGESGIVVPVEHPDQLSEAVIELLSDPDRRLTMGAKARVRVAKAYSIENMVRELERIYTKVLGMPLEKRIH